MFLEDIVKGVSLENENTEFKRILDEGKSEKQERVLKSTGLRPSLLLQIRTEAQSMSELMTALIR